jgi:hypothetical protein
VICSGSERAKLGQCCSLEEIVGILLIIAIGAIAFLSWRTSLRRWPYGPCRRCGGTSRSSGSNKVRWNKCPKCGGTGRQLRFGAREP